ncbi:MAG: DEAD/DEAH box helicase [Bradyrhizobiaceae bacterium]|nr:DEAD/DEAH box helicase [Bradyrhizobiaceae bacterium]
MFELAVTPHGALTLRHTDEAPEPGEAPRLAAFERGVGHGLLWLGANEVANALPPAWSYWRSFARRYVAALCAFPPAGEGLVKPTVPAPELDAMAQAAPPMIGGEYLTAGVLRDLWQDIDAACDAEFAEAALPLQEFLKTRNAAWNLIGRVHFNLAENRRDEDAPFAFLATYTPQLSAAGKAQHLPLGKALQEYGGAQNRERLLSLLMPVQRAAEHCAWLKAMVDAGEIFHALRWTPRQALQFLKDVPALESAGVVVRMPGNWRMNRPARPKVTATVGGRVPSNLGMDALLDFKMAVTLDGDTLSAAEIKDLLAQTDGLALIRGKWVEIDHERLSRTLDEFRAVEARAKAAGLSFGEAMRLVAGAGIGDDGAADARDTSWSETVAGPWLKETLAALREAAAPVSGSGNGLAKVDPGKALKGTLRPYQQGGVQWLHLLVRLGLGACLADDMGLGKTIQVLSLLLVLKAAGGAGAQRARAKPSLLVAPASLLANWAGEIEKFAPSLKVVVVHPSASSQAGGKGRNGDKNGKPSGSKNGSVSRGAADLTDADVVITSYGYLVRDGELQAGAWRLVVLDEAQAIKNPAAKQTQTVKRLKAQARIALTGTPIENRLGDLWSIFDFINPGLLGSSKQFTSFVKSLGERPDNTYGPLRNLVRPYILRRLKTDKAIIADLPDKTEVKAFCPLSRKQAALYQKAVQDLQSQLDSAEGIARKGIVLASLTRLKQICNHPSQWLGDGSWAEQDSGKLGRLRDIAEVIADKQEKVLIFTQFKEMTAPLAAFLGTVFGRAGVILHGETAVAKRKDLVRRFQEDDDVPFFVLSLKAGGAGLNLTAASHVIHFDRWWNPAVENQATDRAFRIGQTRNVLVHKFVCRGTVEDRIDQLIESKKQLAGDFLSGGADVMLTEMKDDELLKLVALDLNAAMKEP